MQDTQKTSSKEFMDEEIRRSLSYSVKDGVAWSVNSGLGNSYMTPYILAMNANPAQVGFLTSVPNLIANLSQIETPKLMEKMSRKRIVTMFVFAQAMMWIPISMVGIAFLLLGINGILAPMLVIIFYTLYLLMGSFVSPAWSSWMGDLVPEGERGRFFGRRNTIVGTAGLCAMLLGGVFLDAFSRELVILGFVALFISAMIARLFSFYFLTRQYEPSFKYGHEYYFGFFSFVRKAKNNNFGRFTIYATAMALAVNIASPFFAVYMLKELNFSYITFVAVTLSSSLANVIFMPVWGKFSDRRGNLIVLKICGLLVPVIPVLWLFSTDPPYLIAIEGLGGFLWAGFNLASSNFIYDAVSKQRRGICFAYFGALNGAGVFLGATIGGMLATYVKPGFMSVFLLLFLISGALRLLISVIMLPRLHEVRKVEPTRPLWYFLGDFIRKRLPPHSH
ncbi:MAG: MFS transporter [Candidatus Hadarchaeales archaeon]